LSTIAIDGVRRSFGSVEAVSDITLEIRDSEFFTLLGPSGCGKTTLLRMIAGFSPLDAGQIRIDRRRIDGLPPHRRNIGMVFQNYAIFPNLSVAGNIGYGLKARRLPAHQIAARVEEALTLVRLQGYSARWPHQLSGGQLQRVAIARALVTRPDVLLLDEPLSNLDARLRIDMRAEIRELQQRLNMTTVYVTHDQEEALAVSHRIAVMRAGKIEQLGDPKEIYRAPANLFVAQFMGTTNVLSGTVSMREGAGGRVRVGASQCVVGRLEAGEGEPVSLCIRPEALRIVPVGGPAAEGEALLQAILKRAEFIGAILRIDAELPGGIGLKIAVLDDPRRVLTAGSLLSLAYDPLRVGAFTGAP
jgi:ABC-type Fe3+/spermidine/putrescine transport system ATPase subunit